MTGHYLQHPAARHRLGLTVIESYLNDRSAIVHWLRPSIRPEPPVPVELVYADPEPFTFGHVIRLLSGGVVLGLLAWVFVVGLFAVGGAG